jgi:hypothetical protein
MYHVTEFDGPLADWLAPNGWTGAQRINAVGSTDDFDRDYFTWKAGEGGSAIELRVTRRIVDDYEPIELVKMLDTSRVADFLRKNGCVVVQASSTGGILFASC